MINGPRSLALLLLLLAQHSRVAFGHVKLYYEPPQLAIRNANGATSDGQLSVSGACGGNNNWGDNGVVELENGQEVTLRVNYNGGHQSNANEFRMAFKCGAPDNQGELEDDDVALTERANNCKGNVAGRASDYPVPAPDAENEDYYEVTCTLPEVDAGDECTISVLDQRDWGGCVDTRILEAETPAPSPQPTEQLDTYAPTTRSKRNKVIAKAREARAEMAAKVEGSYGWVNSYGGGFSGGDAGCDYCGVTSGSATVEYHGNPFYSFSYEHATVKYDLAGKCGTESIHPGVTFDWVGSIQLKRLSEGSEQFVGYTDFEPSPRIEPDFSQQDKYSYTYLEPKFRFILSSGGELTVENAASGLPEVCDGFAELGSSGSSGDGGDGGGSEEDGGSGAGTIVALALVALVLGFCAFGYVRFKKSQSAPAGVLDKNAPRSDGKPSKMTEMPAKPGKPGKKHSRKRGPWEKLTDESTGDSYWWNSETDETSWDRPMDA